jgi:aspartate racemase
MPEPMPPSQMRMLGIIGGTAWHSTIEYYRHINTSINALYGNQTNPPLIVYNLNQARIHELQRAGDWNRIADIYHESALRLESAGCQGLLLGSNTAHRIYDAVADRIDLPILHIADAIGTAAPAVCTLGLLGTRFTMELDFLSKRLLEHFHMQTLVPASGESRTWLHDIIQRELAMGEIKPESKLFILEEIALLKARGAEAIVLGCTELPLIIGPKDVDLPVLDTTLIHARLAVDFILGASQPWKPIEIH